MNNYVDTPIQGRESFDGTSESHVFSQAALLLCLGQKMRAELGVLPQYAFLKSTEMVLPEETLKAFPLPELEQPSLESVKLFTAQTLAQQFSLMEMESLPEIARQIYSEPTYRNVSRLLDAALQHKNELTRVAAAFAYLAGGAQADALIKTLVQSIQSDDLLVREVGATALANFSPDHPALESMMKEMHIDEPPELPSYTSFIVHGTWARSGTWWRPSGDFHTYVLVNVRSDLYSAMDRYDWSGGYSDQARQDAADELCKWVTVHHLDRPVIFAHSHGGSVCMLASQNGLTLDKLVLLSCPVHIPKYTPNYSNIKRVISIRVHMDLVILADIGGQVFNGQQIEEHFLPLWFNHSATHDPDVWKKYNIPSWI